MTTTTIHGRMTAAQLAALTAVEYGWASTQEVIDYVGETYEESYKTANAIKYLFRPARERGWVERRSDGPGLAVYWRATDAGRAVLEVARYSLNAS